MGYSELFETKSTLYREAKSGRLKARDVLEMLQARTDFLTGRCIFQISLLFTNIQKMNHSTRQPLFYLYLTDPSCFAISANRG